MIIFIETKKYYFSVKNKNNKTRVILAETKFEAIAKATEKDNGIYPFNNYVAKKIK